MSNNHEIGKYLSRIHRLQLKYLKPLFSDYHIPPSSFSFILSIYKENGISQKHLSDLTRIDEAMTTRLVRQLEAENILYKQRNPHDKRAFQLYLTDKGKSLVPHIQKALDLWWQVLLEDMPTNILEESLETMMKRADIISNQKEDKRNG